LIILPGIDPIYVRRCPLRVAVSQSPPIDIQTNDLLSDFAIVAPMEVFPTPGGPTKQSIFPYTDFFNYPTAINSRILSLTSFIP